MSVDASKTRQACGAAIRLTGGGANHKMSLESAARRGGTFHFWRRQSILANGIIGKTRQRAMSTAHLLPAFARVDLTFDHGEGCWLTATNGERYLDFTSGIGVNALGHAHPKLVDAIA